MHDGPAITVITVCRDAMETLPRTVENVLSGLGSRAEYVIQDGASTDGTVPYLEGLGERVTWGSEPDEGIYDAMNRAVARAKGDWILFLGADDLLVEDLDLLVGDLREPHTIYYGDVRMSPGEQRYGGLFTARRLASTNIPHQGIFYPRSLLLARGFSLDYPLQADWEYNMHAMASQDVPMTYINRVITFYHIGGQSSMRFDDAFQRDYPKLLKRYFPFRLWILPLLRFYAARLYRALPGVSAPQQRPPRS